MTVMMIMIHLVVVLTQILLLITSTDSNGNEKFKKFVSNCGNLDEIFHTNKLSEKGKSGLVLDKSPTYK